MGGAGGREGSARLWGAVGDGHTFCPFAFGRVGPDAGV